MDKHLLACRDRPSGPQPPERGDRSQRHGRGLLEAEALRLERQGALGSADILGEAAEPTPGQVAVHCVARLKLRDAAADRRHPAGDICAEDRSLRPAQP